VTALRGGSLVDLVDREIFGSSQIRSLDLFNEFVSRRAKCVAALGYFHKMDLRIEIVEGSQIRCTGVVRRIDTEEINGVRALRRWSGLGDLAIHN
jgi:hypothetical protein